jgi:hypothetical protein
MTGCGHRNIEIDSKDPINRKCLDCGKQFRFPEEWGLKAEDLK